MTLPKVHVDHETVDVAGALFDLRVITRAEQARVQKMVEGNAAKDDLEITVIGFATDTDKDEVRDWYANTAAWVVQELLDHIARISRLDGEAQKSGGTEDRAGGGRPV